MRCAWRDWLVYELVYRVVGSDGRVSGFVLETIGCTSPRVQGLEALSLVCVHSKTRIKPLMLDSVQVSVLHSGASVLVYVHSG